MIVSSLTFLEGGSNLPEEIDEAFYVTWYIGTIPIHLVFSDLVARFMYPSVRYCLATFFGGCYWYLGSLLKVDPKFWGGLLCNGELCPGKSSMYLLVS